MAGVGSVNPGVEAIQNLAKMGYRAWVEGEKVRLSYEGRGDPDPSQVRPLLETVKAHKDKVRFFLKCHCPKCGGIVFVGNECFLCDWLPQARSQDKDTGKGQGQGALSCGECGHFLPSQMNPAQGFGRCALERLSKRTGAYPGKTACPHFEATAGEAPTLRLAQ